MGRRFGPHAPRECTGSNPPPGARVGASPSQGARKPCSQPGPALPLRYPAARAGAPRALHLKSTTSGSAGVGRGPWSGGGGRFASSPGQAPRILERRRARRLNLRARELAARRAVLSESGLSRRRVFLHLAVCCIGGPGGEHPGPARRRRGASFAARVGPGAERRRRAAAVCPQTRHPAPPPPPKTAARGLWNWDSEGRPPRFRLAGGIRVGVGGRGRRTSSRCRGRRRRRSFSSDSPCALTGEATRTRLGRHLLATGYLQMLSR